MTPDTNQLMRQVDIIMADTSRNIHERSLDAVRLSSAAFGEEDLYARNCFNIRLLNKLIVQFDDENTDHEWDDDMLQLYIFMAEACRDTDNIKVLKSLAEPLDKFLHNLKFSAESVQWSLPKLIDIYATAKLGEEVCNLLEIFLFFMYMIDMAGMEYDRDITVKYMEVYFNMSELYPSRSAQTAVYINIVKLATKLLPSDRFHRMLFGQSDINAEE